MAPADHNWRFSRASVEGLPSQGWKLHVAATILTAARMLRTIGPALTSEGAYFKGPRDLRFLDRLNSGIDGFSQTGKCFTVYCRDASEAASLAAMLHRLTAGMAHPGVPYDRRYRPGSAVHYRYGAFDNRTTSGPGKVRVGAIRNPRGRLVPDRREAGRAVPGWVDDPLRDPAAESTQEWSPLALDYRAFKVLRRRGKGSVYLGLDLTRAPARLCVIKEGLRHGETDPLGHDGYWRVRREVRNLRALSRAGIPVPSVIAAFDADDAYFVVLEHIEGATLAEIIAARDIDAVTARSLSRRVRQLVNQIHDAGWAWRDLKPENLLVTDGGALRPVDFEGACRLDAEQPLPGWGTAEYLPARWSHGDTVTPLEEDLHAARVIARELTAAVPVLIDRRSGATYSVRSDRLSGRHTSAGNPSGGKQ